MPANNVNEPETAVKEFLVIEDLLLVPPVQGEGLPPRRRWKGGCIPSGFSDVVGSIEAPFPRVVVAPNTTGYTWSPILVGARFSLQLTVARKALPFQILLSGANAQVSIQVRPVEGVFTGTTIVPAEATRTGDFSNTKIIAIDFLTGQPMPDNKVIGNRIPIEYTDAMNRMPPPTFPQPGHANVISQFNGPIPDDRRLILDDSTIPALSAAWQDLAGLIPKPFVTTVRLLVGGQEVAAHVVTIPVHIPA